MKSKDQGEFGIPSEGVERLVIALYPDDEPHLHGEVLKALVMDLGGRGGGGRKSSVKRFPLKEVAAAKRWAEAELAYLALAGIE